MRAPISDLLIIGDRRELEHGMEITGQRFDYTVIGNEADAKRDTNVPALIDISIGDDAPYERAISTECGRRYSLEASKHALSLTQNKRSTHAMMFAPVNKTSLHMAGMEESDEMGWFARQLDYGGTYCDQRARRAMDFARHMTSRVTSHMALKVVSAKLSEERIVGAVRLLILT